MVNIWTPLCGNYTKPGTTNQNPGEPMYDGVQDDWVKEEIDLNAYAGGDLKLRFTLISDGWTNWDGFYFDDMTITIIGDTVTSAGVEMEAVNSEDWLIQNFPNPASNQTMIQFLRTDQPTELVIFDLLGNQIYRRSMALGSKEHLISTVNWQSGIYFYHLVGKESGSEMYKMIVTH